MEEGRRGGGEGCDGVRSRWTAGARLGWLEQAERVSRGDLVCVEMGTRRVCVVSVCVEELVNDWNNACSIFCTLPHR